MDGFVVYALKIIETSSLFCFQWFPFDFYRKMWNHQNVSLNDMSDYLFFFIDFDDVYAIWKRDANQKVHWSYDLTRDFSDSKFGWLMAIVVWALESEDLNGVL